MYLILAVSQAGCTPSGALQVTPIDAEANGYLMSDELDPGLYDTRSRRQYYTLANLDAAPAAATQRRLDDFVRRHYTRDAVAGIDGLSVLFYNRTVFADYAAEIHEAARSDAGFMPGYRASLAAQIRLERLPGAADRWSRSRMQYVGEQPRFRSADIVTSDMVFSG